MCDFTIEEENYIIDFNRNPPKISYKKNGNNLIDDIHILSPFSTYAAEFNSFRIIFIYEYEYNLYNIIKYLFFHSFSINLNLFTDTNGRKFWNNNFKNDFTKLLDNKPYKIPIESTFQNCMHNNGFNLYIDNQLNH